MKKTYRYLKFHIKTAWNNIKRHFGMTFSSAFAVSLSLIFVAIFLFLNINLNSFTIHIEDQLTIRASIDTIVDEAGLTQLKSEIANISDVKSVGISLGSEELDAYRKEYSDQNNLFEMYDSKNSPIRDALIISMNNGKNVDKIAKDIEAMPGVVNAKYGGQETKSLVNMLQVIRNASAGFVAFMVVIALFLISNKIKMSIYTRKDEMAIMRYVGASNWCIKWPMVFEGIFIGAVGAIIPILFSTLGYSLMYEGLGGKLLSNMLVLQSPYPLVLHICLLLLGSGAIVGMLGSLFSTSKYLRVKR